MWRLVLLLLMLGSLKLQAQISLNYSIGFVGENFDKSSNIYSGSFILENEKCIVVSNGISKYNYSTLGKFENKCILNYNINPTIEFNVFPNPTNDFVIVKTSSQFVRNDKFNIVIYNILGQQLEHRRMESSMLKDGLKISLKYLSAGWYTIIVSSEKFVQSFKILKI